MRLFIGILAAAVALGATAAHAAPGDIAKNSPTYQQFVKDVGKDCEKNTVGSDELKDETATKLELLKKTNQAGYRKVRNDWMRRCGVTPPAQTASAEPQSNADADESQEQPRQVASVQSGDNYEEVRKYLRTYKGPLWHTRGSIRARYMNRQAPQSAVPCKPPGYDHVVLCAPRDRRYH